MTKKDFETLLKRPELNKSGIADLMYPNNNNARIALNNKLSGKRNITQVDLDKAWEVLKDLADDIKEKAPANK